LKSAEALHASRQQVEGESLTDKAKDKYHEGKQKIGAEEPSVMEQVKGKVEQGYESLKQQGEKAKQKLSEQSEKAKQTLSEGKQQTQREGQSFGEKLQHGIDKTKQSYREAGQERPESYKESAKQRTGEALGRAEDTMHEPSLTDKARETITRENESESLIEKAGRKIGEAIKGAGDFVQHKTGTGGQ
jgi:ElaB/YqjD/DUF883 family membrane-anchored ribosome-binding protein